VRTTSPTFTSLAGILAHDSGGVDDVFLVGHISDLLALDE
jgi:hypothetical protein